MTDTKRPAFQSAMHFLQIKTLWGVICIAMLGVIALLSPQDRLLQLNRLTQDFLISTLDRPLHDDIIIVAIDDDSIAELGRWPWRRTLHAELLDRISADHPKAIGLDVLFTEREQTYRHDDDLLAAAIKRSAPVVLPVFVQNRGVDSRIVTPLPEIAQSAARMGVAHIKVDTDGVVRSVYLYDRLDGELWEQFGVALLVAGGQALPALRQPVLNTTTPFDEKLTKIDDWAHQQPMLVAFSGGAGYFKRVSYADVLHGKLAAGTFKDKYVLVGATAAGIADQYATPTSGLSYLMPGVEILANITDGLLHDKSIKPASSGQNVALNLIFVSVALVGFVVLSPFLALALTFLLEILLITCSYFALEVGGILLAPAAGILGLAVIYPLWSWHRLNTAARYLSAEFASFQQHDGLLSASSTQPLVKDFLDRRIAALEGATRQLQSLHRFVNDSVDNLPYPTLIAGIDGIVRIANLAAAQHFKVAAPNVLVTQPMSQLIADVISNDHQLPLLPENMILQGILSVEGEARDSQGRDLIVKCVPIFNADNAHTGWILNLVDVSTMRQAERDREEAFRFITHDIRSPLSSIISLLELRRLHTRQDEHTNESLMQRLETYADNALALADNFVNLARAKSGQYQFENMNLGDLISETIDEAWVSAHTRNINIQMSSGEQQAYSMVDRHMFKRALTNLLSNAVKFSPDHSLITCTIQNKGQQWDIAISDHGAGIPKDKQATLFQPFNRLHASSHPQIKGTGLGLAFVYSVMNRHGGSVFVESDLDKGSTFHLLTPMAASPIVDE